MLPNIHILGIQGSGKGTQSALLVEKFALSYASSGNLFRERAAEGDEFGKEIASKMQAGKLLPNEYLYQTIENYLSSNPIINGFLGDGVIRSISQYDHLLPIWGRYNLEAPALVHLELTEEVALARIAQRQRDLEDMSKQEYHKVYGGKLAHRTDDNPSAIQERFALFHSMTKPVIARFEEEGRCVHISADQPIEKIHQEICNYLEKEYPSLTDNVAHKNA
jgi:adenylate kinase